MEQLVTDSRRKPIAPARCRESPVADAALGFSLIELMAVIAITAMAFALVGTAVNNISREMNVGSAGDVIAATLQTAHDYALANSRDVEVRLYSYKGQSSDSAPAYRALQIFARNIDTMNTTVQGNGAANQSADDDSASTFAPLGKIVFLPAGTIISNVTGDSPVIDSSSVLSSASRSGTLADIPALGSAGQSDYSYKYFSMLANGATDLPGLNNLYYLTVIKENDWRLSKTPANYSIVQIDPSTGHISVNRP
jgi:uncharacterized protein (TIGR02596 family)